MQRLGENVGESDPESIEGFVFSSIRIILATAVPVAIPAAAGGDEGGDVVFAVCTLKACSLCLTVCVLPVAVVWCIRFAPSALRLLESVVDNGCERWIRRCQHGALTLPHASAFEGDSGRWSVGGDGGARSTLSSILCFLQISLYFVW